MARWTASPITSIPRVIDGEADDPTWYPLQHALGIDTFGANVLVASRADQTLVEEHDERASGQQELYVVLDGGAMFELEGEHARLDKGTALAVTDPSVRRSARAVTPGTALLVVGAGDAPFRSTWNQTHFDDIPRPTSCRERSDEMTRYLISFPSSAMSHIPAEEMPAVGEAAHAVVQEAMDAGVWVFGGGVAEDVDPVMVAGDGTVTAGTYSQTKELNGGLTVIDAPSREAALEWAAKIAAACRCAQEIREFMPDPAVGN